MTERGRQERDRTVWDLRRQDPEGATALADAIGVSPLVAQILLHRDLSDPDAARRFLSPSLSDLTDPDDCHDLLAAATRIKRAVRDGEAIAVHGDYDVDGISGTALLLSYLRHAGTPARGYIPDRFTDGYGLSADAVRTMAAEGIGLLVTVDHGTTAIEEIALARAAGMDVVVLDHHTPGEKLPEVAALVNPHLDGRPGAQLCGVGVVFRVVWSLARLLAGGPRVSATDREFLARALGLVALGTVADVVPLRDENRILAHHGLARLGQSRSPGLRALLEVSRVGDPLTAGDIGFRLAPRINAAGRMGSASLALELLLTEDPGRAGEIAGMLEAENRRRREIEAEMLARAIEQVEARYEPGQRGALVLGDEGWHAGVIGIVAARLVDRYHRPAVLVAFEGGVGRGSCRSIAGVALPDLLGACAEHLTSFGGHARAAGLSIAHEHFEVFRTDLERVSRERIRDEDLVRRLHVDVTAPLGQVNAALISDLERLAPFGEGNPRPLFATRGLTVAGRARRVGKGGDHLSMIVSDGKTSRRTIGFRMGELLPLVEGAGTTIDIAYQPLLDTYRQDGSVQLQLTDLAATDGTA